MTRLYGWLAVFFAVAFFGWVAVSVAATLAANRVVRVVDGDTVILNRSGKLVTCRMIGCNTPETVHPNGIKQFYGIEASDYVKLWIGGKVVRVDYEYPTGDPRNYDKYKRLLVYLWADKGRQLVNLELVSRGFARYESRYRTKYRAEFKAAELAAKTYKLGVWSQPDGT